MLRSKRNPFRLVALSAVLVLLTAFDAFAQTIINGDFEAVNLGAPGAFSSNPADIPGWTHTGSPGDALLFTAGPACCGGTNTALSGDDGGTGQFVLLGGGFTVVPGSAAWSQTLTGLTIGQTYVITFMTASEGETPTQQITVGMIGGSSTPSQTFTTPVTNTEFWQNWGTDQYTFLADATSGTLQFSVTSQQYDVGLDAVSISAAGTTPEPSSLLLLGTGLIGGLLRRRVATR